MTVPSLIRVHAHSLAIAQKDRACAQRVAKCHPTDSRNCRIVVNALRREIDRLQRGIDRTDIPNAWMRHSLAFNDPRTPNDAAAAVSHNEPRMYSVEPLGTIPMVRDEIAFPATNRVSVTHLGSLIDVLI